MCQERWAYAAKSTTSLQTLSLVTGPVYLRFALYGKRRDTGVDCIERRPHWLLCFELFYIGLDMQAGGSTCSERGLFATISKFLAFAIKPKKLTQSCKPG